MIKVVRSAFIWTSKNSLLASVGKNKVLRLQIGVKWSYLKNPRTVGVLFGSFEELKLEKKQNSKSYFIEWALNYGPLWYGPGRKFIGSRKGIERSMDVKIPHGSWPGWVGWGGGKGHSFWNHRNDFPWGHRRKWNVHLMKYSTSSVLIPCLANHKD